MAATEYTDPQVYAKYNIKKSHSHSDSGCKSCGSSSTEKCGCCPAGLVQVFDENNEPQGCVTGNDAELLFKNTIRCPDGYIKVVSDEGDFLGCLTPTEFATYTEALA